MDQYLLELISIHRNWAMLINLDEYQQVLTHIFVIFISSNQYSPISVNVDWYGAIFIKMNEYWCAKDFMQHSTLDAAPWFATCFRIATGCIYSKHAFQRVRAPTAADSHIAAFVENILWFVCHDGRPHGCGDVWLDRHQLLCHTANDVCCVTQRQCAVVWRNRQRRCVTQTISDVWHSRHCMRCDTAGRFCWVTHQQRPRCDTAAFACCVTPSRHCLLGNTPANICCLTHRILHVAWHSRPCLLCHTVDIAGFVTQSMLSAVWNGRTCLLRVVGDSLQCMLDRLPTRPVGGPPGWPACARGGGGQKKVSIYPLIEIRFRVLVQFEEEGPDELPFLQLLSKSFPALSEAN